MTKIMTTRPLQRSLLRRAPLALLLVILLPALACAQEPESAPRGEEARQQEAAPSDTIDLRTLGYAQGDPSAPVTVVEFSDFGCPYCAVFALETYPELYSEFVETGKVYWRYVPFVMGMFPNGAEAARAVECAAEQGGFWPMHDLLYERQRQWKGSSDPEAVFAELAGSLDLDGERFDGCYAEDRGGDRTYAANYAADRLGIRATPTFLINGRMLQGAAPLEQFRAILRDLGAR